MSRLRDSPTCVTHHGRLQCLLSSMNLCRVSMCTVRKICQRRGMTLDVVPMCEALAERLVELSKVVKDTSCRVKRLCKPCIHVKPHCVDTSRKPTVSRPPCYMQPFPSSVSRLWRTSDSSDKSPGLGTSVRVLMPC